MNHLTHSEREALKLLYGNSDLAGGDIIRALIDQVEHYERALREIANPIQFWIDNKEEDVDIDIPMAMHIADNPFTYQNLAKAALTQEQERG